jgi:hypothetical protein
MQSRLLQDVKPMCNGDVTEVQWMYNRIGTERPAISWLCAGFAHALGTTGPRTRHAGSWNAVRTLLLAAANLPHCRLGSLRYPRMREHRKRPPALPAALDPRGARRSRPVAPGPEYDAGRIQCEI